MTLHWWMHWFWITCLLSSFVCSVESSPLPLDSVGQTHQENETAPTNIGSTHRAAKSIGQTVPHSKTQLSLPFPVTSDTSDTPGTLPFSDLFKPTKVYKHISNDSLCTNRSETNNLTDISNLPLCSPLKTTDDLNVNANVPTRTNTNDSSTGNVADAGTNSTVNDCDNVNCTWTTSVITTANVKIVVEEAEEGLDNSVPMLTAASITGISFGVLMFVTLVGVSTFFMYRRRYLNKPQTLNDKCSNPDSSGYIDDSTIRENSEEMYSLDNDSFLNSLEAMTIQNYWTDSVKHTKL